MYGMPVKRLNEQVRRNADRFPEDFVFQLTKDESDALSRFQFGTLNESDFIRSRIATLNNPANLKSQNVTSRQGRHAKYLPYAFTEHGTLMAAHWLRDGKTQSQNSREGARKGQIQPA
jgi:hypothetical protein